MDEGGLDRFLRLSLAVFQGGDRTLLKRACEQRLALLQQLDYLSENGLRPRGEVARRICDRPRTRPR